MSNIDPYRPRYLIRKQLLEEQRELDRQEKREQAKATWYAGIIAGVTIVALFSLILPPAFKGVSEGLSQIKKGFDVKSDLTHGRQTVRIIYAQRADIHHIVLKLQESGYTVKTSRASGFYREGKVFSVGKQSFENEHDLYNYLNGLNNEKK